MNDKMMHDSAIKPEENQNLPLTTSKHNQHHARKHPESININSNTNEEELDIKQLRMSSDIHSLHTHQQSRSKRVEMGERESNLSENSTSHTFQIQQQLQKPTQTFDQSQYINQGFKQLKLYNVDNQSKENVACLGSSEKFHESKLDVYDNSSKISSRGRVREIVHEGDFKRAAHKSRELLSRQKTPASPTSALTREEIHFQNNISRELVGKKRNNNKPNMHDYQLVINANYTQYEVLQDVADEMNMRLSYDDEEDWDIWWIDGPILPTLLLRMKPYQRTNHVPAIYVIARKNLLARNLTNLQTVLPNYYDFFPQTWILPADSKSFKEQFNNKRAKTFIIKPESQSQGKGIFLTRNSDWAVQGEHYVAQRYLHKPYLIDNLKFDLRIYVLITGIQPLRCFIYKEGLARFATEEYHSPMGSNLNNLCMHLTNYAINKDAEGFIQNENEAQDDIGHKRSLTSILNYIDQHRKAEEEKTGEEIWEDIKQICVKTIMAGIHPIAHLYRSSKPQDVENSLCFQILGIDIFLDEHCKSWLIEVNHTPSFMTDSPLDYSIKKNLLRDTIHMLNLTQKRKNRYLNLMKNEIANRLVGGHRLSQKEKEVLKDKKTRIKDKYENNNLGDFQNLYPLKRGITVKNDILMDAYDMIYRKAREIYEDSTAGKNSYYRNKKEEKIEPIPVQDKKAEVLSNITVQLHPKKKKSSTNLDNLGKEQTKRSRKQLQKPNSISQQKKNYTTTSTFQLNQDGCNQMMPDYNCANSKENKIIHNIKDNQINAKDKQNPVVVSSNHLQVASKQSHQLGVGPSNQNNYGTFQAQSQMILKQNHIQAQKAAMEESMFNKRGDEWYNTQGQVYLHHDLMKQMEASINESNKIFMKGVHLHQQNLMIQQHQQYAKKIEMPFKLKHPAQQQLQQYESNLPGQLISKEDISNEFQLSKEQNKQNTSDNDQMNLRKSNNSQSYGQKQNDFLKMHSTDKKGHPPGGVDHNSQFELVQAPQHSSRTIDPTNFHYSQQQYGSAQPTQTVPKSFNNDATGSKKTEIQNYQLGHGEPLGITKMSKQILQRTQQFQNNQSFQQGISQFSYKSEVKGQNFITTPNQNRNQQQNQYTGSNQKSQFGKFDDIKGNSTVLNYIQQSLTHSKAINQQKPFQDQMEQMANMKHKPQQQQNQLKTAGQQNNQMKNGTYASPSSTVPPPNQIGLNEQSNALIQKLGIPITISMGNKTNNQLSLQQCQSLLPSNLKSVSIHKNESSRYLPEARQSQPNISNAEQIQHSRDKKSKDRNIIQNSTTYSAVPAGNSSSKGNRKSTFVDTEKEAQNFVYFQNDKQNKFPTVNNKSISQKGGIMQIMQIQNMHNMQQQLNMPPHSVQKPPTSKQYTQQVTLQHDNSTFQMADIENPIQINGGNYMPKNYSKPNHLQDSIKKPPYGNYFSSSLAEGGQGIVDNNKQRGKSMILNKQQGKQSVANQNIFNNTLTQSAQNNDPNPKRSSVGTQQPRSGTGHKVHMPNIIDKAGQNAIKTPNQQKNYNFEKILFPDNQKYNIQGQNQSEIRLGYTQSHEKPRPENDYIQANNTLQNQLDLRQ